MRRFFLNRHFANFFSGIVANVLLILVTLVSYPIFLSELGAAGFGIYSLTLTVGMFFQLTNLGIGPTVIRFSSEFYSSGEMTKAREVVATAMVPALLILAIAALGALCFSARITDYFGISSDQIKVPQAILPIAVAMGVLSIIMQAYRSVLLACGKAYLANATDVCVRLVSTGLALAGVGIFKDVLAALLGNAAGVAVVALATGVYLTGSGRISGLGFSGLRWSLFRTMLPFSLRMTLSSLANFSYSPLNRVMIARFYGVEGIPVYDIAYNVAMQVRNIFERGISVLAPEVARRSSSRDRWELLQVTRRLTLLSMPFTAGLWILLMVMVSPILQIWLGDGFDPGMSLPLRFMLGATFVGLYGAVGYHVLVGSGEASVVFRSNLLQSGANFLGLLALIQSGLIAQIDLIVLNAAVAMVITGVYLIRKSSLVPGRDQPNRA